MCVRMYVIVTSKCRWHARPWATSGNDENNALSCLFQTCWHSVFHTCARANAFYLTGMYACKGSHVHTCTAPREHLSLAKMMKEQGTPATHTRRDMGILTRVHSQFCASVGPGRTCIMYGDFATGEPSSEMCSANSPLHLSVCLCVCVCVLLSRAYVLWEQRAEMTGYAGHES